MGIPGGRDRSRQQADHGPDRRQRRLPPTIAVRSGRVQHRAWEIRRRRRFAYLGFAAAAILFGDPRGHRGAGLDAAVRVPARWSAGSSRGSRRDGGSVPGSRWRASRTSPTATRPPPGRGRGGARADIAAVRRMTGTRSSSPSRSRSSRRCLARLTRPCLRTERPAASPPDPPEEPGDRAAARPAARCRVPEAAHRGDASGVRARDRLADGHESSADRPAGPGDKPRIGLGRMVAQPRGARARWRTGRRCDPGRGRGCRSGGASGVMGSGSSGLGRRVAWVGLVVVGVFTCVRPPSNSATCEWTRVPMGCQER